MVKFQMLGGEETTVRSSSMAAAPTNQSSGEDPQVLKFDNIFMCVKDKLVRILEFKFCYLFLLCISSYVLI